MPTYSWLTNTEALAALSGRLYGSAFWTPAELQVWLNEALRTWNALTEQWNQDFVFASGASWNNLGTLAGSPRLRTVTDTQIYTAMQYHLLEPPTGAGTWTGTNQFNLAGLQFALQKRRDEMIQATSCNLTNFSVASTPGSQRFLLPDTTLEPQRMRFIPVPAFGPPITMTREDTQAFQWFDPEYLQSDELPQSWAVSAEPPLSFDVDHAPNLPGSFDVIALKSGPVFAPPAATLLGVPDDWSWLAKWGALADLLGRESEATDVERAAYCLKRFTDGLQIMRGSNWLLQANLNGVVCDTPSLFEQDASYGNTAEWQGNPDIFPVLVNAGMDFVYAAPSPQSVNVKLVGNQPIPTTGADFIQVSRDVFDVVLSYAQRLASFKMGGAEFSATKGLEDDFYRAALATNKRLALIGIYDDVLHTQGQREQELVPR